jgi:hypothetical protein
MDLVGKILGWRRGRLARPAEPRDAPARRPRPARPADASFVPVWSPTIDGGAGTHPHAHHHGQTGCDTHGGHAAAPFDAGCGGGHHGGH